MARLLRSNCVIDEFTSNVDRNVALSCATSIGKFIRKNNLQGCVFVSCHKDFIDCLCPDYVIDVDDEAIYDTKGLLRRKFEIQVQEQRNKQEIWNIFRQYHYLSGEINLASRCFVAYLNEVEVACCYVLPQPSGTIDNAWRVHRLVVLPDYQGLGIGTRLLEFVADLYAFYDANFYLRTTHEKLHSYCDRSSNWKETRRYSITCPNSNLKSWKIFSDRPAYSYKYIGKCLNLANKHYEVLQIEKRKRMSNCC